MKPYCISFVVHGPYSYKTPSVVLDGSPSLHKRVCKPPVQYAVMLEHSHSEKWLRLVADQMPNPLGAVDAYQTSRRKVNSQSLGEYLCYMHSITGGCDLPTTKDVPQCSR